MAMNELQKIHDDEASHKFYLFKTQNSFEPIEGGTEQLYRLVEYAIMFCNCGAVMKMKVKQPDEKTSR